MRLARTYRTLNLRSITLLVAALVATLGLSACGKSHTKEKFGDTEGTYLSVGDLEYQVQTSRQLNISDPEDKSYLRGVPAQDQSLAPSEAWFAVFVRVENTGTKHAHPAAAASDYTITDTQGTVYRPIPLDTSVNNVAYAPTQVPPGGAPSGGVLPVPGSPAATGPVNGELLLFKIKVASIDNRPLVLKIANPEDASDTAEVNLDI